ncbi:hypothetical protein BY996DRAFT_6471133 [Phakopsora pachyrhizi]|nr:hypothetical protein BY996DRAFT_6471133 [Phakopsora pachyrhizi]
MRATLPRQDQHSHLRPILKPPRERQRSYRTSGNTNPFWPLERSQEEVDQVELVRVIESLKEGLKVLIEENSSLSREISERELIGLKFEGNQEIQEKIAFCNLLKISARDPSAEQQDQSRPSRLERKGRLYLIKLKLDCRLMCPPRLPQIGLSIGNGMEKMIIKREMMMAHSLNTRESFSVRQMEYISDLYGRDLPDIINSKTNSKHQSGVLIMKDTVNLKLDSGARAMRTMIIVMRMEVMDQVLGSDQINGFKGLEQDKDSTRIKGQKSRGYRIKRIEDYNKKKKKLDRGVRQRSRE